MSLPLPSTPIRVASETVLQLGSLRFSGVRYVPAAWAPFHDHEETTLFLVLQGAVQHDYRKQSSLMTPSTLAFVPAGELHSNRYNDVETFEIRIKTSWLERLKEVGADIDAPCDFSNSPPVWAAMRLCHEYKHQDALTPLALEGLMLELLVEMSRDKINLDERKAPRWLKQAKEFLHEHFSESVSLEAIAAAAGVHPAHLTRVFRQRYQTTPGEYLRRLRVETACRLLSASELSIAQLAVETGFADQGHFSRNFKSYTGMTPAQFRKISSHASLRQKVLP